MTKPTRLEIDARSRRESRHMLELLREYLKTAEGRGDPMRLGKLDDKARAIIARIDGEGRP